MVSEVLAQYGAAALVPGGTRKLPERIAERVIRLPPVASIDESNSESDEVIGAWTGPASVRGSESVRRPPELPAALTQ